jgi:hypothetical protein
VFASRYMPCQRCGASLERSEEAIHECSVERILDYRMFALRHAVAGFDHALHTYLDSPAGRSETSVAARQIRASRD